VLFGFSITPNAFKAASSGASIATRGSRVRYRLSEDATTTCSVERVTQGRKVGSTCRRQIAANPRRAACTRFVAVSGNVKHKGRAGANSFRFSGRNAGHQLAVGRYRLEAVTKDAAGNVGPAKTVRFGIKR
jgi:hypothetical protein